LCSVSLEQFVAVVVAAIVVVVVDAVAVVAAVVVVAAAVVVADKMDEVTHVLIFIIYTHMRNCCRCWCK